ncbi:membrane protein [Bacteroidia bacterium]|nr:membrane protein [Bacteroidia bacterium]GHV20948.1 membrane protein [Bacteroidia bacterium]
MFKQIFELLVGLITQPAKAWSNLSGKQETNNEEFYKSYLYPLFGIVALLSFVGVFLTHKNFDVQLALKNCIGFVITAFVGFYLASYFLSKVMGKVFNRPGEIKLCQRFVGYSSSFTYVLFMVLSLFPELFFLKIFLLYTIYIIWEGAIPYMVIEENIQMKFTVLAGIIILLTPFIIEMVMFMLMPGLRS